MKWTRSSGGEKPTPVSQSQLEAIDQPTNLIEVSDKWISSDVMSSWSSSCNIVLSAVKSKSEKDLCKFLLRSLIQITLRLFVPCAPFLLSHLFLVVVCLACSFPSLNHSIFLRYDSPCTYFVAFPNIQKIGTEEEEEEEELFLFFMCDTMCDICCIAIIFSVSFWSFPTFHRNDDGKKAFGFSTNTIIIFTFKNLN